MGTRQRRDKKSFVLKNKMEARKAGSRDNRERKGRGGELRGSRKS